MDLSPKGNVSNESLLILVGVLLGANDMTIDIYFFTTSEPGMSRKHTPKSQHHAPPPALPTAAVGSVVPGQVVGQTTTGPLMYVPPTPAPRIFTTNQPNAIVLQVTIAAKVMTVSVKRFKS